MKTKIVKKKAYLVPANPEFTDSQEMVRLYLLPVWLK